MDPINSLPPQAPAEPPAQPPTEWPPVPQPSAPENPRRLEPAWGLGMVALGGVVIIVVALVFGLAAAAIAVMAGVDADTLEDAPGVLVFGLVGQQIAMGLWPVWLAKSRGRGVAIELGWHRQNLGRNLGLGVLAGVGCIFVVGMITVAMSELVGLDNEADAGNADFLEGSIPLGWMIALTCLVVIGAPLSEELFFRGLLQRTLERRWSVPVSILASAALFGFIHLQPGNGWDGNLVLVTAIVAVGLALAALSYRLRSLAGPIAAHVVFNGTQMLVFLLL